MDWTSISERLGTSARSLLRWRKEVNFGVEGEEQKQARDLDIGEELLDLRERNFNWTECAKTIGISKAELIAFRARVAFEDVDPFVK